MTMNGLKMFSGRKVYSSPPFLSEEERRELDKELGIHEEPFSEFVRRKRGENIIIYIGRLGIKSGMAVVTILLFPLILILFAVLAALGLIHL